MGFGARSLGRYAWRAWAAVALGAALALASPAAPGLSDGHIQELVAFEENQFPEGLSVAPGGTVHVGIASTGEIVRVTPNGTASVFAQVPLPEGALLIGVYSVDASNVFALVSSPDASNGVWRVSSDGQDVTQIVELPAGSFPNDLARGDDGALYVTDTIGGRVFRVAVTGATGTSETWLEHELLLGNVDNPGPLGMPIGANGVAFSPEGDALYVAVSEGARIVRVEVETDGSAGAVSVVAEDAALGGADGIDVGADGTLYVAVNGQNQIVSVDPATGEVAVVASGEMFRFPAVLRFSPDFSRLYVTNFDAPVLFGLAPGPAQPGLLAIDTSGLAAEPAEAPGPGITPPAAGSAGLR